MTLKGLCIGSLNYVGESPGTISSGAANADGLDWIVSTTLDWWYMTKEKIEYTDKNLLAFARTILGQKVLAIDLRFETLDELLVKVVGAFADYWMERNPNKDIDPVLVKCWTISIALIYEWKSVVDENFDIAEVRASARTWVKGSASCTYDRRFFLLGRTMGTAPKEAHEGDIVCVPLGCPLPMVLRRIEDYHVVVGAAYIDGYMDGEALDLLEGGRLALQDFELR